MPKVAAVSAPIPDVLKALSDEMRWSIVSQMADVEELACTTLEHTLPVSKPTISYHVKVLYHAGLLEVRKEGRNYFYRLRRDVLDSVIAGVAEQFGLDVGAGPRRTAAISRSAGPPARASAVATSNPRARASRSTGAAAPTRSGRATGTTGATGTGRSGRAARSA